MAIPAVRRELLSSSAEDSLAETLDSQFAHQCQACRGKQHLLAYIGCVGYVCYGDVAVGCRAILLEQNVSCFVLCEVLREAGKVAAEVSTGLDRFEGYEGLVLYRCQEASL